MSKFAVSNNFLHGTSDLKPLDAVGAIVLDENERVLLQLRDDLEHIFFPNHWGCFGGALEEGESHLETLHRELEEELNLTFKPEEIDEFITVSFNPTPDYRVIDRYFYIVRSSEAHLSKSVIGEGQESRFFTFDEALKIANITPYDRMGMWLYYHRNRVV